MRRLYQFYQKDNYQEISFQQGLKRVSIKILIFIFKGLIILKKILSLLLFWLFKFLLVVSKVIFRVFLLRLYKVYFFFKRWFLKIFLPAKSRFFYPLTRRSIVHFTLIISALFISTANISAREIQVDPARVGQKSILYSLINDGENFKLIEETLGRSQTTRYFDEEMLFLGLNGEKIENQTFLEWEEESILLKPEAFLNESETRTGVITYTVETGDTISTIAQKFSISVNTILWANKLNSNSLIRPGDKLVILPVSGVVHQVKKGDTLTKIAKTYSADIEKIIEFNKLADENDISQGETLIVPGGKITPAPVPRSTLARVREFFVPPSAPVSTGQGMLWPSGARRITQYFTWRHSGLDIAGPSGTAIYAAEAGTVIFTGWSSGYGNKIDIDHGNGMVTRYGHLSKFLVSKGEKVEKGQVIGLEGSTGWSTGPHLHFEVIVNGVRKNPLSYIK